jgi:putative endonuclease
LTPSKRRKKSVILSEASHPEAAEGSSETFCMFYTYIITNYINTVLYVGVTNNLKRRVREHQRGSDKNSFSSRYKLYKLIWFEEFNNPLEAIVAEKRIKGWTRVALH